MAPRQRNTPATSDDDSYSNNAAAASLSQERQSSARRISMEKKAASRKRLGITEADIARDNHDYFNIVALAIVVYTISLNYDYPSLQSYTGEYFWSMWVVSLYINLVPTTMKRFAFFGIRRNIAPFLPQSSNDANLTAPFFFSSNFDKRPLLYISLWT